MYQMLKVAGMNCLTMYDSGSSGEAVQGDFAIAAGFTCVDNRNQLVNVAGGGTITTGFGIFRCVLGPLDDGRFVRKVLVGLKDITKPVAEYDLCVINNETRSVDVFRNEKLPLAIGGMSTKLLIGIDSPELLPEKILELPSGLAVFRAKFTDVYGSRIVYGGPHEAFKKLDTTYANLEFNTVTILFKELCNSYQNSLVTSIFAGSYCKDEQDIVCSPMIKYRSHKEIDLMDLNATCIEEIPTESQTPIQTALYHNEQYNDDLYQAEPMICSCCGDLTDGSNYTDVNIVKDYSGDLTKAPEQVRFILDDSVSLHKMKKTSKQISQLKEEEELLVYSYRCTKCQSCPTCLSADKTKLMCIREEEEDKIIENSVTWDRVSKTMFCRYPWIQDPNTTLKKLWGKSSNVNQAHAIFKQQTRKPKNWKDGATSFHEELIKKGYVCKVSDLNPVQQEIINKAKIKHYLPWRVVAKPDSVSTPYRIVTDPSVTHMNSVLAKGSNSLSSLYNMLVRFRIYRVGYSFDLSKMYNTLRLTDQMLPYSLYLMSKNLGEGESVEEWCFLTLIYGLVCAGNLAMYAVRFLAEQFLKEEPLAHKALADDLYMDDGFSGSDSLEKVTMILESVKRVLPEGGFKIKCITISGVSPSIEASSDGISTGLGGYVWHSKEDLMKIGMSDINFNKKVRGYRKPNEKPIVDTEDLDNIIPNSITRRLALSKTAEFWDIVGLLEPVKVKFKLDLKELICYDWDDTLSEQWATRWKENFHLMAKAQKIMVPRAVVPIDAVDANRLELLVTCDASTNMSAAAVYARFRRKNGMFSCELLTARSRSVAYTVPRNELCSNVLAAEMLFSLKKSFGEKIESYLIMTDSVIALSWLSNTQKLLKPFCFNRVRQCHRLADPTCWRHIPGVTNPADHATKGSVSEDLLDTDSTWFKGYPWMREDLNKSALKTYEDICNSLTDEELEAINKETVVDPIAEINHIQKHRDQKPENLVDFVKLGFKKAFHRLALVIRYVSRLRHRAHMRKQVSNDKCKYCHFKNATFESPAFQAIESQLPEHNKLYSEMKPAIITISSADSWITWNTLHKSLSKEVKAELTPNKLKGFQEHDGILYSGGRLSTLDHITTVEDLQDRITPFYEELRYLNPVALVSNPVVYALMIYLHIVLQHCGVERLVNSTFKVLYVERCRPVARRIRHDCIMCKIKLLRVYKMQIANQNRFTYTIAPPFYASQVDIISKFKAHDVFVRTTKDCYVLILVCCLTQAVALYVLEKYDTASVVSALIRHSSRYGWPKFLLPDEGAQLLKIKDLKFTVRDLQLRLWSEQKIILDPCSPKSHWEHGRAESRVGSVRDSLQSMLDYKHSILGWQTVMDSISSTLNGIPITRGNDDRGVQNYEFDLITPFSCLLGHNSNRMLDGVVLLEKLPSRYLEKVKVTLQAYYEHLLSTIHRLIPVPNKWKASDPVNKDDVVLFLDDEGIKYKTWKYGRILETNVNGRSTKVRVGYQNAKEKSPRETYRHPTNCIPIWKEDDIDFNTEAHFRAVTAQQKYENPN